MRRTISLALLMVLITGCSHQKSSPAPHRNPSSADTAAAPPPPPPKATPLTPSRVPMPPMQAEPMPPPASDAGAPPAPVQGGPVEGSAPGSRHFRRQSQPTPAPPGTTPRDESGTTAQHVSDWFKQLKEGAIEHQIPPKMTWKQQSTVYVVIHGYAAPKTTQLSEPSGTGTLKVSDRMKIQLLCPDNPDEFTIEKEPGTEDVQFVPMDSTTTWRWQVTPKYPRKAQKLTIQAWVLYPGAGGDIVEELPVYTAMLDVDASMIGNAERGFWNDPSNWIKYMLPGGAGFIFLAGIVVWIKQRFAGGKPAPKSP